MTERAKPILRKDIMYNLMIFLGITGVLGFVFLSKNTLVSLYNLSKIVAFFCCITFIIPFKFHKKLFHFGRIEAGIFNVVLGIVLLVIFFGLNYSITISEQKMVYDIVNKKEEWNRFAGNSLIIELKDNFLEEYPEIRRFDFHDESRQIIRAKKMEITLAKGIFGFSVIKNRKLI